MEQYDLDSNGDLVVVKREEPAEYVTEDGYHFYRLPDGRYADRPIEAEASDIYDSFESLVKADTE